METLSRLENFVRTLGRVVVGFSGGVDSALLAVVARRTLGRENAAAVTGDSAAVPSRDRLFVQEFCCGHDIEHHFLQTYEYDNPNYRANPDNRCFFCKEELYKRLREFAAARNAQHILDGTNLTDLKGHRPGYEALQRACVPDRQAEVVAPYVALQIGKEEVRKMAAHLNLEVATKPQTACLASRIPTGTPIDAAALKKVDDAENFLRRLGLQNPRVRFHGGLARLELKKEEWELCLTQRKEIEKGLLELGFHFVTLDLKPYAREG